MSGTSLDEMFQPDKAAPLAGAGADGEADGFDDLDLEPATTRRIHPLTASLLVALVAVGAFAGGVAVQKSKGTAASVAGLPGGLGARGAFGEFPGGPGGAGVGGAATGTGGGTGAAASAAVIGQVVSISGNTLTIKNFGGKTVVVHLPAGTTVSKTTSTSLSSLSAGTTVSVAGTTAADGSVTATAITTRGGS